MSPELDPFSTLGLKPTFDLEPAELDRRQRELTIERRTEGPLALEMLNQAVRLLKDPVTRAEQVFRRLGLPVHSVPSESFLERVFAEREQIEVWRRGNELGALQHWLQEVALPRQRELIAALTALLTSTRVPQEQALSLLDQLRYGARSIAAVRLAIDAAEG